MRHLKALALTTLGASLLIGCSTPNEYTPSAEPTELSAYAAKSPFPANTTAMDNTHLTAIINKSNGQITIRNFDNGPIANFKLWINQTYVLHVSRIEPNSSKVFNAGDFYNSSGNSMKDTSSEDIHKVQVETTGGELWNVQGPQME